jgi:3-oxoadipate enol-lactonase
MAWIDLNGVRTWYVEHGSGEPLLLLHGLGSSSDDWLLQIPTFSNRWRVIAPDLRGHGRTPLPDTTLTIEQMAADMAELLERLDARPAHVLGLSMGGCVALALALARPDDVRSLILVNTGAAIRFSGRRYLRGLTRVIALLVGGPPAMARVVARGLFPDPDQALLRQEAAARLSQVAPRAYLSAVRALLRFDARPRLAEIRCPTLVIAGAEDGTLGPQPTRYLADHIPGARLAIIPRSRHVTPIDQPEAFNRTVLNFLEEITRPSPVSAPLPQPVTESLQGETMSQ